MKQKKKKFFFSRRTSWHARKGIVVVLGIAVLVGGNFFYNGTAIADSPSPISLNIVSGPSAGGTEVTISGTNFIRDSFGTFRAPVAITNPNAGTLNDMPVSVTLDTASLIAAGKMRADAGDLRFTDSDDSTPLSYWIESGIDTDATKVWIKIPALPAGDYQIYAHHGDLNLTSESNGDNVFLFFDDFSSGTLDTTSKWTTSNTYTGTTTIVGGQLRVYCAGNTNGKVDVGALTEKNAVTGDITVNFDWQRDASTSTSWGNGRYFYAYNKDVVSTPLGNRTNGGAMSLLSQASSITADSGHFSLKKLGTSWSGLFTSGINGSYKTSSVTASGFKMYFSSQCGDWGSTYANLLDNVLVKPYADTDPTAIVGRDETVPTAVTFGGVPATNVKFVDDSTIMATTPAHVAGIVDVVVTNTLSQNGTLAGAFTYVDPPVIDSVLPQNVYKTGGDSVTITGNGFSDTPSVMFGDTSAMSVNFIDANTLDVVVPAHYVGAVDVTVTNPDGQSAVLSDGVTFLDPAPVISSIDPSSGTTIGGEGVTITGNNFVPKNTGGDAGWALVSGKTLPAVKSQSYNAVVGDYIYMFGGFDNAGWTNTIYRAPVSDPTTWSDTGKALPGIAGGASGGFAIIGDYMYIFGDNGAGRIFQAPLSDPTNWTDTGKTMPAGVAKPGKSAIVGDHIYMFGGALSSGTVTDKILSAPLSDPTNWTDTGNTLPASAYNGQLVTIGDQIYLYGGYTGSAYLNGIYTASTSDPTTWTSTGNTLPGNNGHAAGSAVIGDYIYIFGGSAGGSYSNVIYRAPVSDPTTVTSAGNVLPAGLGLSNVMVIGDYAYMFGGYTTTHISSIYSAPVQHFRQNIYNPSWMTDWWTGDADLSAVKIGGVPATNVTVVDSTTITATTPAHSSGQVSVSVTNYDGQTETRAGFFTYIPPLTADSVMPSSAPQTGGDSVTVTGTNFFGTPTVMFGDTPATSVTLINSNTLNVVVPAHNAGTVNVTVINPDEQSDTLENGFTFLHSAPTFSSVSPGIGPMSGGTEATVTGSNFYTTGLYRKPLSISNDNGYELVDFPVLVTLDTASLVAAGKMRADGGDIRFTDFDGVTALSYWIESGIDTDETRIWVKVPRVPEEGKNIYINYGNLNLTTLSDGYSVFQFFDGFDSESLDSEEWTPANTYTGTTTIVDGQLRVYCAGNTNGQNDVGKVIMSSTVSDDVIADFDWQRDASTSTSWGNARYFYAYNNPSSTQVGYRLNGGAINLLGQATGITTDSGHFSLRKTGTSWNGTFTSGANSSSKSMTTGQTDFQLYFASLCGDWGGTYANLFDNVRLRPYAETDPDVSVAAEENFGPSVLFGGVAAESVTIMDDTTLLVTTPNHAVGVVDVSVTNPDGQSANLPSSFRYVQDKLVFLTDPLDLKEMEVGTITIQAQTFGGDPITASEDTLIVLSSSSQSGFFARDLEEDPLTRWDYTSVVLPAGQSSVTFYYKDNAKGTPTVTVVPENTDASFAGTQIENITSRYRFIVTGITDPLKSGIPSSVTMQAVDYNGDPMHDYTGTIHFSSTDGGAILPPDFTFTANMLGEHTFVNGITMATQGEWCVLATDVNDSNITGEQCSINVDAPNSGTISQLSIITSPQTFPADSHSSAITVQAQDADGNGIPISSDTTIYVYTDSLTGEFSFDGETGWSASQPYTITIYQNSTSASFYYRDTTLGDHLLTVREDEGTGPNIGWENDSQTETVVSGSAYKLELTAPQVALSAGEVSAAFTVSLMDNQGNVITTLSNKTIYLRSSSSGSEFSRYNDVDDWVSVLPTYIPAGSSTITFYYRPRWSGDHTLNVSDNNPPDGATGLLDDDLEVSVSTGPVSKFVFTTAPFEVTAGAVSGEITVEAQDSVGNPVAMDEDTTVYLSASSPGALFSTSAAFSSTTTSVTIPSGNSSVSFYLKQTSDISSQTITASDHDPPDAEVGIDDASQTESVVSGSPSQIVITNSSPLLAGAGEEVGPIHAVLENQYGVEVPAAEDTTLYFYTNSTGSIKEFSLGSGGAWSAVTQTVISAGQSNLDFYYKDSKAGTSTITVSDDPTPGTDNSLTNDQIAVNVSAGEAVALNITSSPQTLSAGQASAAITVRREDSYQNPVTAGSPVTVSLATSAADSGRFDTSAGGAFNGSVTSVTISAGQSSANFYYKDTVAGSPQITVSANGLSQDYQTETINWGSVTRFGLSIDDSNIMAGVSSGEITLKTYNAYNVNVPVTSDLTANLVSTHSSTGRFDIASDGAFDGSITSVTVPTGATSAAFFYKDTDDGSVTLTASQSGYTSGNLGLSVGAAAASQLSITTSAQSLEIGQKSAVITVQLRDAFGNAAQAGSDTDLYLTTTSAFGHFENAASGTITGVTVSSGATSANFYYRDTATGSPTIKVSDYPAPDDSPDQGLANTTQEETIIYGLPKKFDLSAVSNVLVAGEVSEVVTLSTLNNYNQVVPVTGDLLVNLASSQGTGAFDTDPDGTFLLTSVTIPSGQSSVEFYYKDTVAGSPFITASKTNYTSDTYTFNIGAAATYRMVFTNAARTTVAGNASLSFVAQFRDQYGNVSILSSPVMVDLATSETGGTGVFAISTGGPWTATGVTAGIGVTTATFYYKDTKTGVKQISVSADGLLGDSQDTTINPAVPASIGFITDPQTVVAQNPSGAITVQAYDTFGNAANFSSSTRIDFSTSSAQAEFSMSSSSWSPVTYYSIPAGQGSLTVYYKDWIVGTSTLTIRDHNNLYAAIDQDAEIIPGTAERFVFSSEEQTIITDTPSSPFTFFVADINGNETGADSLVTAALSSTSGGGEFSLDGVSGWTANLEIEIQPGETQKSFYYRDSLEGAPTVSVNASGFTGASQDVTVMTGTIAKIVVSSQDSVAAGTALTVSVETETESGLPVAVSEGTVIDLSESTLAGSFSLTDSPWSAVTSVTIPAGQYHKDFYFKSTLSGLVTLTADEQVSQGWTAGTKDVTVTAGTFYKLNFTAKPTGAVAGEASEVFTVETEDEFGNATAMTQDTTAYLYTTSSGQFSLASDGPWNATSATIFSGTSTAQFYYLDSVPGNVTITASDATPLDDPDTGIVNAETEFTVAGQTPEKLVFVSDPQSIIAGQWSEAVTIQAQRNDGTPTILGSALDVTLGSAPSSPGIFSLTQGGETVTAATIPAGASSITVYYQNTEAGTHNLSAESGGLTSASQSISVTAADADNFVFLSSPQTKSAGVESNQMRVQLRDQYANAATADHDLTLSLSTNSSFGEFSLQNGVSWSATSSVVLSAGSSDVYFYYKDTASGTATLTIDELPDESLTAATQDFVVSSGAISSIDFATNSQTLLAGEASDVMTVTLHDQYGNVATAASTLRLYLYSTSADGSFSTQADFSSTVQYVDVAAGQSSKSFYYKDVAAGSPTLYVSDQSTLDEPTDLGITNAVQAETINWGSVAAIAFTNPASVLVAGQTKTLTVELKNQHDVSMPAAADTTIYLHSTHVSGKFSLTDSFETEDLITSFVFSAGETSRTIYHTDTTSGSVTLTASDVSSPPEDPDAGITNGTQTFSVTSADLYRFAFITSAQSLEAGQASSAMRVEARDVYGNAKTVGANVPVYFYSTSGVATFSEAADFAATVTESEILEGSSTVQFYYKDTATGSPVVTVSDASPLDSPDTGILNAAQTETINAGNITKLAFSSTDLGTVIAGGISDPITVYAQNQYGVNTPALSETTIYLFSSSGSGDFSGSSGGPWTGNTVVISSGQTHAEFYYRDTASGSPTITASDTNQATPDTNWTNATATITVDPGSITQINITSSPQTITARHPSSPITIETQNIYGNPTAVSADNNIYLRSTSSDYEFAESSSGPWGLSYVTITTGNHTATAYYHDTVAGTPTITAADSLPLDPDTGWTNDTQEETIELQVVDHLLVTNISDPQIQGNPSSIVVMAQDSEDYLVDWYTGTTHFTSSPDPDAVLPADYTFTAVDRGLHTFGNGVAFLHTGEKSVTATDTSEITGTQYDITVTVNTAGPIAKLKFIDITPPLVVNPGVTSQQLTLQSQDADDQPSNAPEGGFAVRLTSTSGTGEFALSAGGPWNSTGLFTIPAYLNSVNFFYRDSNGGTPIITGSDWVGGVDEAGIQNATLSVQVKALAVGVTTDLQVNNNAHYYIENPIIFAKNDTGAFRAKTTFTISVTDGLSGLARNADLTLIWRDPEGDVVSTETVNNTSSYEYTIIPIDGFAASGNYTFEIEAVDTLNGNTGENSVSVPVSGWTVEVLYDPDSRIIGEPLPFTVETRLNGALADPDDFSVNFRDNNGEDVTGSSYHREKADLTKTATGQYGGTIETTGLVPEDAYYLYARVYDDGDDSTLAEDNHYDIFFENNPTLAPANFAIEKILTSAPPAAETYDLKFNWDESAEATKYNLYRSRDKLATLFQDPCTFQQIKDNNRYGEPGATEPYCETTIQQDVGADDATQWVLMAEVDAPATEYTIPWSEIQNDTGDVYYYLLRAENGIGESGYSTMTFSLRKEIEKNVSPVSNINWISLPYYHGNYTDGSLAAQPITKASDIVKQIEGAIAGSAGDDKNVKINKIALWDSSTQNASVSYYYSSSLHRWIGTDFSIDSGDGVYLSLSDAAGNFNWTIVGNDISETGLAMASNASPISNINWVSLPYSTKYAEASEIVTDLEGSLVGSVGNDKDLKINKIALWDSSTQNASVSYYYSSSLHRWIGTDFTIATGDAIYLSLSGNTLTFNWRIPLLLMPYE